MTGRRCRVEGSVAGRGVEAVRVGAGGQQTAAEVGRAALSGCPQGRQSADTLVDVVVEPSGTGSGRGQLTDERDVIARDGVVQLTNGTSSLVTLIDDVGRVCVVLHTSRQKHPLTRHS